MAVSSKKRRRSWLPRRPKRGSGPVPETRPQVGEAAEPGDDRLRRAMLVGVLVLAPPLLLYLYYRNVFPGLLNTGALDFAQLGRNLSEGRGFVTYILRPLTLTGDDPLRQLDTLHGPLYPFLVAIAIGAMGEKDSVVALVSGIFYMLTVPAIYLLGRRMFHRAVGLIAALVFTGNALMLEYGISGLHITLYAFLSTWLFLALYHVYRATAAEEDGATRPAPRAALVAVGLLLGLLYLTDPVFVWAIPGVLALVYGTCRGQGWRTTGHMTLPLLLLVLPWMARNWVLAGNPLFGSRGYELWMHTKSAYPGYLLYRMTPDGLVMSVEMFKLLGLKVLLGAGQAIQNFPQVTASWVLAFFLPSLLFPFRQRSVNAVRAALMVFFLCILAGTLLFEMWMPIFVATIPAMLVFSVAYMLHLVGRAGLNRRQMGLVSVLLGGLILYPLASQLLLEPAPKPLTNVAVVQRMGQTVDPDALILSDAPSIVAWYADRPTVWLPRGRHELQAVQTRFPTTRHLYLSRYLTIIGELEPQDDWNMLYQQLQAWNLQFIQAESADSGVAKPPKSFEINRGQFRAMIITPQAPRAPGEWRNGLAEITVLSDSSALLP